jgi:hypothetical protein
MKFLKKIYELDLINEEGEAPPPPGMSEAPDETALSPESEVMYELEIT